MEARGVEPLSENTSPWASPGADDLFTFPLPCAARQAHGFSSFIVHGALKALRAHVHHLVTPTSRAVVLPGRTAALVTQQQVQYYRYLIYKLQFLKRPAPLPAAHVSASPSKPVRPHGQFSIPNLLTMLFLFPTAFFIIPCSEKERKQEILWGGDKTRLKFFRSSFLRVVR